MCLTFFLYNREIPLILLLFLLLAITSCSNDIPYGDDINYKFTSEYSGSNYVDTLLLDYNDESGFASVVTWTGTLHSESGNREMKSSRNVSNTMLSLEIPTPTTDYFAETELLPFPKVNIPIIFGDSLYSIHEMINQKNINKSNLAKGYLKVVDKKYYNNRLINDTCWVIKAHSVANPDINATYYYHEKFGFAMMEYNLPSGRILIQINEKINSSN